ncbi:sigma-70 family RNA polymerase sigma factor [uncultured Paludibaculum sp.]|uniref:sigma-70 family RNA polymerase sigma factor n=1 Tax=uncultured Paludibaculum sp. TaxID=1765020 RepID=UPI002AAAF538|nr:sigma-70 family RNA polymerase sigma factor [uncultured Paludibaculum sp.]
MGGPPDDQITLLLRSMRQGNVLARTQLAAAVYPELKRIAAKHMQHERPDHTLQPTALVHEAFVKLVGTNEWLMENRGHFFAVASQVMRQILVDHARQHLSLKRGSGGPLAEIQEWQAVTSDRPELVIDIDRLLSRLEVIDERQAQVVVMRYFAGFAEDEIAAALSISVRTVKRDWSMARAWLLKELTPR